MLTHSLAALSRRQTLGLLSAVLLSPRAALAAPISSAMDFKVDVAGLHVADAAFAVEQQDEHFDAVFRTVNKGLASVFTGRTRRQMRSAALRDSAGLILPQRYRSTYEKPDRTREVEMVYDAEGQVVQRIVKAKGKLREFDVPRHAMENTVDPLTAGLRMQDWVARSTSQGNGDPLQIAIFDGRTRSRLDLTKVGFAPVTLDGRTYAAHEIRIKLERLVKFDDDGDHDDDDDEKPLEAAMFLEDGARATPLMAKTLGSAITASVELKHRN